MATTGEDARRALARVGRAFGAAARLLGRAYQRIVITGRWLIVALWIAAAAFVTMNVPVQHGPGEDFGNLLPPDSEVVKVAQHSLDVFEVPFLAGTNVVLHNANGLSLLSQADSYLWALATTEQALGKEDRPPGEIVAAIPIPIGSRTTTVTYLFLSDGTGITQGSYVAQAYASHFNNIAENSTYVTGFFPSQAAQSHYLTVRLPLFEMLSVVLIIVIVSFAFRSLLAPLMVLGVAAIGYLVYFPLLTSIAAALHFSVPGQLEPVLLALLLGVVTDYCVLFFADLREELAAGHDKITATRTALHRTAPVVAVAGMTVAGGTIALLAAPFGIFRGLGPALALTVVVGLLVCLTLTPAIMAIFGAQLFRVVPWGRHRSLGAQRARPSRPPRVLKALTKKGPAAVAAVIVIAAMLVAALPLATAKLDLSFSAGLPRTDPVYQGSQLLDEVGLRGITEPTEVILEEPGIVDNRVALARLQGMIQGQPGVVRVLGPADSPLTQARGIVLSRSGAAARYVVVFDSDPLAHKAINDALHLQSAMPELAERAGLGGATISMTGQTLIASEVARLTSQSIFVTLLVAVLIEFIILALYLRAVITSVVLLICNVLSVAATLGLTTYVFQDVLGHQGLTFYAPFASAVLLIALGSDYNVFAVGAVWSEARRQPMRDALLAALPRTARAITIAGVILAATFSLVAVIPLSTFRQIAFAMAFGLLFDTLVLRPILTPAVLTLLGSWVGWPGRIARAWYSDFDSGRPSPRALVHSDAGAPDVAGDRDA